jgi:hypothetical protein
MRKFAWTISPAWCWSWREGIRTQKLQILALRMMPLRWGKWMRDMHKFTLQKEQIHSGIRLFLYLKGINGCL